MKANTIIEINKAIISTLTSYPIFNEFAPDITAYPFLVFKVSNTIADSEATEAIYLDIDGWDNYFEASGSSRIETMMAYVITTLQNKLVVVDDLSFRFLIEGRKTLTDTDPNLRRRKQIYQIRAIGKE